MGGCVEIIPESGPSCYLKLPGPKTDAVAELVMLLDGVDWQTPDDPNALTAPATF